ncbi:MAG: histidine kinase, partial [Aliifodinibius sp.]|nr:histidine kinase [candidate division Zixibacteria bacterium]NIT56068.1 histidine kinase [Fodinibius sp.]NIS45262.1 histidine kinase [candidate division Zixibacteria bacterium]NIU13402.1 histidine kinase [candidate division Zixibacteria bacterium]NIV05412.1 histidine kinase [candidate division Zixibacteria bacterium]
MQTIFEDAGGVIWVGTFGGGINKYDPNRIKFRHYRHVPNDPNSLSHNQIFAIEEDSRNSQILWIGTFGGGLNKFNRITGEFTHYRNDPDNPFSLSEDFIQDVFVDNSGTVWIGTAANGLDKFDPDTEEFISYKHQPGDSNSLSDNRIRSIDMDSKGILWVGTYGGGLNKLNQETDTFTSYKHDPQNSKSLSNNVVKVILEGSKGQLWLGTLGGGLDRFNRETELFTHYQYDPDDTSSLSHNVVQSIYQDKDGILWIATYGGGLNKFNPQNETFTHFTEQDGLPHNSLYDILADKKGHLWISSNRGLSKFNPQNNMFRNYDINDGLQSNEFSSGASHKCKDGEMFFGGINGFNRFYPDSIKDNPHVPPIVITNFQKFNQDIELDRPVSQLEELVLSHKDYVFSFKFAALDYSSPEENQYAYMLAGFEENWNYSGSRRFVTYTNLDPGEYVFRVKGSNSDDVWNETGASIQITIIPPFWETWWFTALISALLVLSLVLVIARIKIKERKKRELNKRISDLKIAALASQMKPHFVFNTINSIQYLISNNDQKDALNYLSKFSRLLRMTLEHSLKSAIPISKETKFLELYLELEQFRHDHSFDYSLAVEQSIDADNMEIPIMCIQPYVENAIIHGLRHRSDRGELSIRLELEDNKILCTVQDNGIGIQNSLELKKSEQKQHTSVGMKITRERIELLQGSSKSRSGVEIKDL